MSGIIADLWNGNISLCDHCGVHDRELKDLLRLMERNRNALFQAITDEQQTIFGKYTDCAEDYLLRMTELAFQEGFRFATKLLSEALAEEP